MKKIPTIYKRDPNDRSHVTDEINPECQWVFDGEGVATRKYDGTCVKIDKFGYAWARREIKKDKPIPPGFETAEFDEVTGKTVGWVPAFESSFYKFLVEAQKNQPGLEPGTYELIGPKINGNPENTSVHYLQSHTTAAEWFVKGWSPRDYVEHAKRWGHEGVVWHHPDGRMAKLKVRDIF